MVEFYMNLPYKDEFWPIPPPHSGQRPRGEEEFKLAMAGDGEEGT